MIDRCPYCSCIVAEEDTRCPSCQRDMTLAPPSPKTKNGPKAKSQAPSFIGWPEFTKEDKRPFVARAESPWGSIISFRWSLIFSGVGIFIVWSAARQFNGSGSGRDRADSDASVEMAMVQAPQSVEAAFPQRSQHAGALQSLRQAQKQSRRIQNAKAPPPAHGLQVFLGGVYDLITLEPINLAHVVFTDAKKNRRYETYSRFDGHFRMSLPAVSGRGYYIDVEHSGYQAHRHLVKNHSRVAQMAKAKRDAMAEELYKTLEAPVGLVPSANGRLDVWLIPKRQ